MHTLSATQFMTIHAELVSRDEDQLAAAFAKEVFADVELKTASLAAAASKIKSVASHVASKLGDVGHKLWRIAKLMIKKQFITSVDGIRNISSGALFSLALNALQAILFIFTFMAAAGFIMAGETMGSKTFMRELGRKMHGPEFEGMFRPLMPLLGLLAATAGILSLAGLAAFGRDLGRSAKKFLQVIKSGRKSQLKGKSFLDGLENSLKKDVKDLQARRETELAEY